MQDPLLVQEDQRRQNLSQKSIVQVQLPCLHLHKNVNLIKITQDKFLIHNAKQSAKPVQPPPEEEYEEEGFEDYNEEDFEEEEKVAPPPKPIVAEKKDPQLSYIEAKK